MHFHLCPGTPDPSAAPRKVREDDPTGMLLQMYKEIAQPPEKMNKTRGIGIIAAPPELVAGVVADEYEAWDDTMKDLKTLTSERDPATGALVEICWSRYCLRE